MNTTRSGSGPVRVGVVVLALATAGIHLYLFLIEGFLGNGLMLPIYQLLFVANFLAYVVLTTVLYLPAAALSSLPLSRLRLPARVLLTSIATASIASYLHVNVFDFVGHLDKVIEVLLIALLTVDAAFLRRGAVGAALQLVAGLALGAVMFLILRPVMV